MAKNFELMKQWLDLYYERLYKYMHFLCVNSSDADKVVEQTFLLAYEKRRSLKKEKDMDGWMMRAVRYCLLKQIYEDWERGEDINSRYLLPEEFTMEKLNEIMDKYKTEMKL